MQQAMLQWLESERKPETGREHAGMSTDKGPNGHPFCTRGLHELTPANDANHGTGRPSRCRACKRWNDQVNEDKKALRSPRPDPVTGTRYADTQPSAPHSARVAAKEAAQVKARGMVGSAAAQPAASPVSRAMPVAPPRPVLDPIDPALPPEPAILAAPPVLIKNGYWSRELAGMSDVMAIQKARRAGLNVCLYGPPGTGKTQYVENAFTCGRERGDGHECSECAEVLHGDGDTLVDDFVGSWQPTETEGKYIWIDGPLLVAMRLGRPFFMDDFTLISPKVLAVVYPVMDGRGIIQVKGHPVERNGTWGPDVVRAAPGFFVIGGHNPRVHGAILSDALRSRFIVHIHVPTSHELVREMGIDEDVIRLAENLTTMQGVGEINWVPQHRDLEDYMKVKANLGPDAALANIVGKCPDEDRHLIVQRITQIFGQAVEPLGLGGRWDK